MSGSTIYRTHLRRRSALKVSVDWIIRYTPEGHVHHRSSSPVALGRRGALIEMPDPTCELEILSKASQKLTNSGIHPAVGTKRDMMIVRLSDNIIEIVHWPLQCVLIIGGSGPQRYPDQTFHRLLSLGHT